MESNHISRRNGGSRHRRTDSHVQNSDDQSRSHESSKRHDWQDPDDPNSTSSEDMIEHLRCQCSSTSAGGHGDHHLHAAGSSHYGAGGAGGVYARNGNDYGLAHQRRDVGNGNQNGFPTATSTTVAAASAAVAAAAPPPAAATTTTAAAAAAAASAQSSRRSTVLLEELKRLDRGAAQIANEDTAQFEQIGKLAKGLLDWMDQGKKTGGSASASGSRAGNGGGGGGSGSGNGQSMGS